MAKAAVEMASWDLAARARHAPLSPLLGGTRAEIASGVSIGIQDSLDQLADKIRIELDAGYRRIKIKVKPGWDVGPVEMVRARFGGIPLMVDANAAYTIGDAPHLSALDRFELMMIEQPLDATTSEITRRCGSGSRRPSASTNRPSVRAADEAIALGASHHQHQAGAPRWARRVDPRAPLRGARRPGVAGGCSRAYRARPQHSPPRCRTSHSRETSRRAATTTPTSSSRRSSPSRRDPAGPHGAGHRRYR
jgi:hypothetical protein